VKFLTSIAMILATLAAILGFSVAGALREERRALDEFAVATRQQVHTSAQALSARLDALDQDTRMLTDLVERSRKHQDFDPTTDRRVWESAFRALAVVVAPYRVIALVTPAGVAEVVAVDPTENATTITAVLPPVCELGRDVSARRERTLGKPFPYHSRSFLLYGAPVQGGGAIVVASDAANFLGAVAWNPLLAAQLFVTDPAGVVWSGCETPNGCHVSRRDDVALGTEPAGQTIAELLRQQAASVARGQAPKVHVSERVDRPMGSWVVTWVTSSQEIVSRWTALLSRIVLTAIAVALAVGGLGIMIFRQQHRSVILENELRYARALANTRDLETQLVRAEKLVTVGVLSTELAHEIGSPLAVIRGRAEHILRELTSGPRADDLRVIIKHIDNISTTIRQLLDFSRRSPAERKPVALTAIVGHTRDLLQWKLDATAVRLDVAIEPDLPMLNADADQLQQVLVNLLLNACDASPAGGIVLLAASKDDDGMVRIDSIDYGCGIPPEHIQAVFDPFFTTKQRGEGTGLGLPIAASIVRNHGGQIDLTSMTGKGTTVTIRWPVAPVAGGAP
jgi:signal transduction histidine kinase